MVEVIPAINAENFEEVKSRLKLVKPYTKWVQLDVADGTFTKNTTWHNPADLLSIETSLNIEVHLMINEIEKRVGDWFMPPVKRIIFHLEASKDPHTVIKKCKEAGKEVGVAIGPDSSWTQLTPFLGKVALFQILAVYPGFAGQEFQKEALKKIEYLRSNCPSAKIEVDGGVTRENAKEIILAGADIIVAASAIFNEKNIGEAIEKLRN